jgi:hypothetical protein
MSASGAARAALLALLLPAAAAPESPPERKLAEVVALMARARARGLVGTARKTKPVDARQAHQGEIVVTAIKGEGTDERSRPAKRDDWVVRVRCPETGNEQYLVSGYNFTERYRSTSAPISAHGWREFRPIAKNVRFHVLPSDTDPFMFVTADGESMLARPGDAIVQDPRDETSVSSVAAASFSCAYEVVSAPGAAAKPSGS